MNNERLQSLKQSEPLNKVDKKDVNSLRVVLFNVNGAKTLFTYHPWNQTNSSFGMVFDSLQADIISLQELKVINNDISSSLDLVNLNGYKSFVTLPKTKKGYSGVGLFVRIPQDPESEDIKHCLTVTKAEEGLTGFLPSAIDPSKKYIDLDPDLSIGGYTLNLDEDWALKLDSEGRCVVIELANNLVIFSLYCPANSMGSEEGAEFKSRFMHVLVLRCKQLTDMGKEVLILGDINISLDLIDQADGINERYKKRLISYRGNDGELFEKRNLRQCLDFKAETPSRLFFNRFVHLPLDTLNDDHKFLYDTTRRYHGRKMGIYTCWNTLSGARQTNYGSRIDLILTTRAWCDKLVNAGAWPFLLGSDHCPIFSDFKVPIHDLTNQGVLQRKLAFESRHFYKLVKHRDISTMFKSTKRKLSDTNSNILEPSKPPSYPASKVNYKSRKRKDQPSINNFFFKSQSPEDLTDPLQLETSEFSSERTDISESIQIFKDHNRTQIDFRTAYGNPPKCNHGELCQLKTSLTNSKTRGKKFWCCPKNSISIEDDGRCSYFQWLSTPPKDLDIKDSSL